MKGTMNMNRRESITELIKGGKTDEVKELITSRMNRTEAEYRTVRDNADLSDEGKRRELADIYTVANTRLNNELEEMARKVVRTDRDDAERVFGIKGLSGDVASLTISRRDAADRVAALETGEEMRDLLRQATRSGDEVLARAIAERAVSQQDDTTMHQFLADRPDLDAAGERLWRAERASVNVFGINAMLFGFKPSELGNLDDDSIAEVARPGAPAQPAFSGFGGSNPW